MTLGLAAKAARAGARQGRAHVRDAVHATMVTLPTQVSMQVGITARGLGRIHQADNKASALVRRRSIGT